jgi:hypothetical protein
MVEMITIGDTGVVDDTLMTLFQCPKCKEVRIGKWIDGTPRCSNCKGNK